MRALSLRFVPRMFGVSVELMMLHTGKIVALVKLQRECAFRYVLYFNQGTLCVEGPDVPRYRWRIIEGVFAGAYGLLMAGPLLFFIWSAICAWAAAEAASNGNYVDFAHSLLKASQHFQPSLFILLGFVFAAMYVGLFMVPGAGGFRDVVDGVEYQIYDFREGDMLPFLLWVKNARMDTVRSRPRMSLYYMMRVAPYIARTQDIEYQVQVADFFYQSNKLSAALEMWEAIAAHPEAELQMLHSAARKVLEPGAAKTHLHWLYGQELIDLAVKMDPFDKAVLETKAAISAGMEKSESCNT
ncbi:MAG: hypothetical protein ACAI35_27970 [Candidatus Methylacidiphilales bacterium]|nr:hypothetical protein [Candidatus Methylacidiphilales bacterium]